MNQYSVYDKEYFETGVQSGKSGYQNYSWMPELTIRMAHYLAKELKLDVTHKILDFGCAKGFLVKALRILDLRAYGVDVSEYAIRKSDCDVEEWLHLIKDLEDTHIFDGYSHVIAKDVLEHVPEDDIQPLLAKWAKSGSRVFIAVPIAGGDDGKFVIPQYHNDVTHITIKPKVWWENVAMAAGFNIQFSNYSFPGVKENWVRNHPMGNLFLYLYPAQNV